MTKLYVAFGSNLSKKQMRFRCPSARPLGKFTMHDAQLVFRTYADLEYVKGVNTPCGLWAINKEDEKSLDRFEGVASGSYFKSEKIMLNYCGRKRPALIYLKNHGEIYPPSKRYVSVIRRGYQDFDLDQAVLDEAIERSWEGFEKVTAPVERHPVTSEQIQKAVQFAEQQELFTDPRIPLSEEEAFWANKLASQ
jgi:hypothetical protein